MATTYIFDFTITSSQLHEDVIQDLNGTIFQWGICDYRFKTSKNETKIRCCVEISESIIHNFVLGKNELKTSKGTYEVMMYLPESAP
jgi:hypothetical protein